MYVKVVMLISYLKAENALINVIMDIIKVETTVLNVTKVVNNAITAYHAMFVRMNIY